MATLPKISIVTAVLNGERFIRQTVESVLGQEGPFELEYIVRDGKSTDATLDILAEFSQDSRLTVVSRRDGSPQEAINAGMRQGTGEIGAWLNADDYYQPGALAKVVGAFAANPGRQWLYGDCAIVDDQGREVRKAITLYKKLVGFVYSRHLLLCENFINQPATFWRMELWRASKSLDPRFKAAWDYELWLAMAAHGRPIRLHERLASFRRHQDSISENHFERQFREELEIACRHGGLPHRLIHRLSIAMRTAVYRRL